MYFQTQPKSLLGEILQETQYLTVTHSNANFQEQSALEYENFMANLTALARRGKEFIRQQMAKRSSGKGKPPPFPLDSSRDSLAPVVINKSTPLNIKDIQQKITNLSKQVIPGKSREELNSLMDQVIQLRSTIFQAGPLTPQTRQLVGALNDTAKIIDAFLSSKPQQEIVEREMGSRGRKVKITDLENKLRSTLNPGQFQALKKLAGRAFRGSILEQLWNQAANAGEKNAIAAAPAGKATALARQLFNNHRNRFWRAVARNPTTRKLFTDAGFILSGNSPVIKLKTGELVSIDIDHMTRLKNSPGTALNGNNLRLTMPYENRVILEGIRNKDCFQQPTDALKQACFERQQRRNRNNSPKNAKSGSSRPIRSEVY